MRPIDLEQLAKFDTPTVCNVIELFDVRPRNSGYMNAEIRACFPQLPPMVGYATTATFRSMSPPPQGKAYGGLNEQLKALPELPGPAVMVFQDIDQPTVAATFGEVMCTMYKAYGSAGLITSGAGRDLDQVQALNYPVFTSGTICSHGYCHLPDVNVAVTVGGISITPGMLLHGDCNGVTTVPLEIADEIPDACTELMRCEQYILDYCRQGNVTPDGLAAARAECDAGIRKLASQISRGERPH
ncbi:RraA family protein [Blastopirellula sp. J2-11]|uniref:RraA family protein n=1 Tax=Blastopirellula sp. J2-11 TaxID=2943192 RepID=UPI0021C7BFB9|nr:RraA family protein [Blastopirellula sp. J2-11]UUO04609.1 RraA family protein [Blastopirellula sp. J2-11]